MPSSPVSPVPIPTGPDSPPFILVFGGTFDPPHRGHLELPARVRDELERRRASAGALGVYIPAARSPHKPAGPLAADQDRLEMLRLALAEARTPRAAVWTDELDRAAHDSSPSFSIDTLTRLRTWLDDHHAAGVELLLLMGADQALSFHRWCQPRDILRLAKPVVMVRGDLADAAGLADALARIGFWNRDELAMWGASVVPVGSIDVSASGLREQLQRNPAAISAELVPPAVMDYIRARGLYQR